MTSYQIILGLFSWIDKLAKILFDCNVCVG